MSAGPIQTAEPFLKFVYWNLVLWRLSEHDVFARVCSAKFFDLLVGGLKRLHILNPTYLSVVVQPEDFVGIKHAE